MEELKLQLQRRLVANVIISKCATNSKLVFNESWCTQDRIIRFSTPFFRSLFGIAQDSCTGYWQTGDIAMYEIYVNHNSISVCCLISTKNLSKDSKKIIDILSGFNSFKCVDVNLCSLKSWQFAPEDNIDNIFECFIDFVENELVSFEKDVSDFVSNNHQLQYLEGKQKTITGNKYERNSNARSICIAHHGAICAVCGFDFEKFYGSEFTGIIEVHHIVPISQIGKEYIVDPIHDLVPLCPNCHAVIHSKKDGFYTVDEVKNILKKFNKEL